MIFDEQRVRAEGLAIRTDTEAALRHANTVHEQRSSQRGPRAHRRASSPARQLMAARTAALRRLRRHVQTFRSRSRSGETSAPVSLPRQSNIASVRRDTVDAASSIESVAHPAAKVAQQPW